ncbi:MAG: type II toxin-antitoxin system CcdA family antitoxin [Betaproteobacteria bacterium]
METRFDVDAPRRPTNLSVNSDLLRQARELDINLSRVLEAALADQVRTLRTQQWLEANQKAIADYNAHIEADGVFSAGLRSF